MAEPLNLYPASSASADSCSGEPLVSLLTALRDCANAKLIACGRPVKKKFVNPGNSVPDDECCAGQVWSRLISLVPADPVLATCGPSTLRAHIGVGVRRCAAVIDDQGRFPSGDKMSTDAFNEMKDLSALLSAIQCCFTSAKANIPIIPQEHEWLPSGVDGGCVGGEWTFRIDITPCVSC